MINHADNPELLAFIEGELDAQQVKALRKRLAGEPRLLAALDKVRADRAALRMIPDVDPPRDLLNKIEPLLARHMLIDAPAETSVTAVRPGEFRRQYRRQHRRIRWSRLAVAAVLLIAAVAAIWAGAQGIFNNSDSQRHLAVNSDDADGSDLTDHNTAAELPPLVGDIHHHAPAAGDLLAMSPNTERSAMADASTADHAARGSETEVIKAEFAIVVHATNPAVAEETLIANLSPEADQRHVALVRNFSYAEAQRLEQEWRIASGSSRPPGPQQSPAERTATSRSSSPPRDAAEFSDLARHVRQQLKQAQIPAAATDSSARSKQLTGPAELAPSLEQQLEFSSRGATHTVAVPVQQLPGLLERLSMMTNQSTTLQQLPPATRESQLKSAEAPHPLHTWLTDAVKVRQSIAQLRQQHPHATVMVPIIIQSD